MSRGAAIVLVFGASCGLVACGSNDVDSSRSAAECSPGQPQPCMCANGMMGTQLCGSPMPTCMCGSQMGAGTTGAAGGAGTVGAGAGAGSGGMTAAGAGAGTGGMITAGTGGMALAGSGGMGGAAGMTTAGVGGSGGMGGAGSGGMGGAGTGAAGTTAPAMDLDGLRQACVDYINMYRATLGRPPLERASAAQETCSDMGAKKDGDSRQAHSSAGDCDGLGAQNTCPGYPVGSGDIAGIESSLKRCLDQMWDEGEPEEGTEACIDAYFSGDSACFLAHGHWINMQDESNGVVACGFYEMSNGSYWMNQDFGR